MVPTVNSVRLRAWILHFRVQRIIHCCTPHNYIIPQSNGIYPAQPVATPFEKFPLPIRVHVPGRSDNTTDESVHCLYYQNRTDSRNRPPSCLRRTYGTLHPSPMRGQRTVSVPEAPENAPIAVHQFLPRCRPFSVPQIIKVFRKLFEKDLLAIIPVFVYPFYFIVIFLRKFFVLWISDVFVTI